MSCLLVCLSAPSTAPHSPERRKFSLRMKSFSLDSPENPTGQQSVGMQQQQQQQSQQQQQQSQHHETNHQFMMYSNGINHLQQADSHNQQKQQQQHLCDNNNNNSFNSSMMTSHLNSLHLNGPQFHHQHYQSSTSGPNSQANEHQMINSHTGQVKNNTGPNNAHNVVTQQQSNSVTVTGNSVNCTGSAGSSLSQLSQQHTASIQDSDCKSLLLLLPPFLLLPLLVLHANVYIV